jgi:hypothetical protein
MSKKHGHSKRHRRTRKRTHTMRKRGGGWGIGTFPIVAPGSYPEAVKYQGTGTDCAPTTIPRPGLMSAGTIAQISGGLPGVAKGGSRKTYKKRGGGSLFSQTSTAHVQPNGVGGSSYFSYDKIPCGVAYPSPPTPAGAFTSPPALSKVMGGMAPLNMGTYSSPATVPTVTVGTAAGGVGLYMPTAGYTFKPEFTGSSATPVFAGNIGYPAQGFNAACLKTGGGKKKAHRKGRKSHRRSTKRRRD